MSFGHLRSLCFTLPVIVILTILVGTVSLFASILDGTGVTQHKLARWWSRMLLFVSGVTARTEGLEKLDPARSYVLVSNHASYVDSLVVLATMPLEFRFFAKHGLFLIPFLGWHLHRAGHLPVVREDPRAGIRTLSDGARLIRERGISVLLFPEGGRSLEALRDFKEGAAYIAIKAGVPIVPIGLVGTRAVLRMHTTHIHPGAVLLRVGDPVETAGMSTRDRGRLTETLHDAVGELTGETSRVS